MKRKQKKHFDWRQGLLLVTLVVATYVLVPQLNQFHSSFSALEKANVSLLALAFMCILGAGITAALAYSQLVFKPVPFRRIVLIQYAGMFINRLLPAGVGGISLFIDFLYRQGHTLARASTIVAINNSLGFAAHLSLLFIAGAISGFDILQNEAFDKWIAYVVAGLLVAVCGALLFRRMKHRSQIAKFLDNVSRTLTQFRSRKRALLRAYLCALLNTTLHVTALTLVIHGFGVELSVITALVVLTGGVAAATVTPTPGGVIGAEAALTAALIAYDVNSSTALAIALSYRFISYWLPILPGIVAFLYVQKRQYI